MVVITKCGDPFDPSGFRPPADGNGVSGPGLGNPWDPPTGSDPPGGGGTYIPWDPPDDGSDTSSVSGPSASSTSGIPFIFIPPGPTGGLAPQLPEQQVACYLQDPSGYSEDPPIFIPWVPLDLPGFYIPSGGPPNFLIFTRCKKTIIYCPPPNAGTVQHIVRRREPCLLDDYVRDSPRRDYLTDVVGFNPVTDSYHAAFDNLCTDYRNGFFDNCLDSIYPPCPISYNIPSLTGFIKCKTEYEYCDAPNQTKLKQIKRVPESCTRIQFENDRATRELWNSLVSEFPPYNNVYDNVCTDFSIEYFRECVNGPLNTCIEAPPPPPGRGPGPSTTGPGGPAAPGPAGPATPGGGPPGGPVSTGGPQTGGPATPTARCIVIPNTCPPGFYGPPFNSRTKVVCTAAQANSDSGEANRRRRAGQRWNDNGPWSDNASGLCLPDIGTLFAGCVPDPINCRRIPVTGGRPGSVDGGFQNPQNPNTGDPIIPNQNEVDLIGTTQVTEIPQGEPNSTEPNQNQGGGRIEESAWLNQERLDRRTNSSQIPRVGSIDNAALRSTSIISEISNRQVIEQNSSQLRGQSYLNKENGTPSVYSAEYNFFKINPKPTTRIVSNDKYLNIFNESVAEEVKYFLDHIDTVEPWSEAIIQSLTNEKIIMSLRRNLLESFNNLQRSSVLNSNFDKFILMVKSHLMTGTLNEVDTEYLLRLNESYKNKPIVQLTSRNQADSVDISLHTFGTKSTNSNFSNYDQPVTRNDLKRTRFLLEDLEAKIPAIQLNGSEQPLYLKNAGIPSIQINNSFNYLNIGDGGGYSINASTIGNEHLPLATVNETSSANYLLQTDRARLLNILGANDNLYLSVSSLSGINEFSEGYNFSSLIDPLYFALELSSVADIQSTESYVTPIIGSYKLISEQEAQLHSRNYTFNTVKVNLDYRDPFIHYARDSSSLTVTVNEFNLRGLGQTRTPVEGKIILRNIPAAVIVSPGRGSSHNPFNGRSRISQYSDTIVRTTEVTPTFDAGLMTPNRPLYQASNTTESVGTPYYGLYEKTFDQRNDAEIYQFEKDSNLFSKSYYVDGTYDKTINDSSLYDKSPEAKVVNIVDRLASVSGVSSLTWWDVYRRLTLKEVAALNFNGSIDLINKISSGWRGVPVRNVLSSPYAKSSGIPEDASITNDRIIINNKI